MKIAYLATRFPFHSQTFVLNEVVAHDRAGIDVLPLSCDRAPDERPVSEVGRYWQDRTVRPGGPLAQVAALSGATIRYPRAMFKNAAWLVRLLFIDPGEFVKGAKELFTAASLAPACERHGIELIHVHFASRSLTAGIMLGRLIDVPVSCTVHAFDVWLRGGRNLRYRLKHCCFIAAISRYHVDYLRRKCGREIADLCHVVHCGIDLTDFDTRDRAPVAGRILLISRLVEKKGHRYLIDACAILKKRGIPCECLMIGTGPEQKRLEEQIERLGLADTVRMLGPIANDQLGPYLNTAAVSALPAIVAASGDRDGVPVSLMEPMACGVPVVSTRVAGIAELLRDGEAGCLVPERDADALADALERLLNDGELAARLAAAARSAVEEEFDIRKTSAELRRLFADATGDKGSGRHPDPATAGRT